MHSRLILPGQSSQPRLAARRPASSGTGLVIFLLVLALGYALARYWPSAAASNQASDAGAPTWAAPVALPRGEVEDLIRHLESAASNALNASGQMKRSRELLQGVAPALEANHMAVEKRRLSRANQASDAARQSIEQAREELEIAKNLLKERSK